MSDHVLFGDWLTTPSLEAFTMAQVARALRLSAAAPADVTALNAVNADVSKGGGTGWTRCASSSGWS
jgi:hypothetical protein